MKKLLTTTALIATIATSAAAENYGSSSSSQSLGRDTVHTSSGSACSQSLSTGKHFETGLQRTDSGGVGGFIKLVWTLGAKKVNRVDCNAMYNNEVAKQSFELQKMQIELQILKDQLARAQSDKTKTNAELSSDVVYISTNGNDW